MEKTTKTIVFSVSVGKGCYRHLRVPDNETLEEFADDILWAFAFCNDHAHAFFMDNVAWSRSKVYYAEWVDEFGKFPHTCDVTLAQLKLKKDDKFKFVFDFGDDWKFQCKVLRVENEQIENTEIIRLVGVAPEQYPEYEDEEYF